MPRATTFTVQLAYETAAQDSRRNVETAVFKRQPFLRVGEVNVTGPRGSPSVREAVCSDPSEGRDKLSSNGDLFVERSMLLRPTTANAWLILCSDRPRAAERKMSGQLSSNSDLFEWSAHEALLTPDQTAPASRPSRELKTAAGRESKTGGEKARTVVSRWARQGCCPGHSGLVFNIEYKSCNVKIL